MKKVFATLLSVAIMLLCCAVTPIEAIAEDTAHFGNPTTTEINEAQPKEDATLTLENIKQSSWEELLEKSQYGVFEEDKYIGWLVEALRETMIISIYHDAEVIKYSMGGLRLEDIDVDRFTQKCQAVLDVYNMSHPLEVVMTTQFFEFSMGIYIESTNLADLEEPVTKIGQLAIVKEGTTYWASSENFGTGRNNMVSDQNGYVPENRIVMANGVSYFDESGNIETSFYGTFDEISKKDPNVTIKIWHLRMVHICTETTDLGWVYPENLVRYDAE